jgi:hypothetical protein
MREKEAFMRLDVLRRRAVIALLLLACAEGSFAQERPAEFDNYVFPGWTFTPGVSLSGMWDSNATLAGPEAEAGRTPGDNVFVIVPSGQIALNSSRTTFSAGYRGYVRRHVDLEELNGYDQRAYITLQRVATPRLTWFASNEYSRLPTTDLLELYGVPFRRLGVKSNRFGAGIKARLTKLTDLNVRYDNQWSSFDRVDEFVNGGTIHGFMADVRRRLTERFTVGVEGRIHRSDVTRSDPRVKWFQDAGGLVAYRLSETVTLDLAGGISHVIDSRFDETTTSPYYRLGLQHGTARATMGIALEQSYTPSFGFAGSNDNRELHGFVHMPFSKNRFYVEGDASWRRSNPVFADVDVRLDTIVSHATVGYAALRWLRAEGYYAYTRQDSIIPGDPIQRHRIGMQLVVSQPMRIQ